MPTGYRLVEVSRVIGHGRDTFERAGDRLLSWSMHRKLGFRVSTDHSRVREQAVALLSIGPLRIPCRVVLVYDDPAANALGFAYGSLPGHPVSGEELFMVTFDEHTQEVRGVVRSFSRPDARWVHWLGPVVARGQRVAAHAYIWAMRP